MDSDIREQAVPVALTLFHHLKPLKNDLLYFQDAFTFYRPVPTICLYGFLNYVFYLLQKLNLPLYSLLSAFVCLIVVPLDYYLYIFHVLCYWFRRPANQISDQGSDKSLPVDVLSARLGTIYCCLYQLARMIGNSLARFSFVDVGIVTFMISALFYVTYLMGDRLVTWVILQWIFFVPLIITRKLAFHILEYPEELERYVLETVRQNDQRSEDAAPDLELEPAPE
jgi:hypothetical protein